jgi:hypothetical protein
LLLCALFIGSFIRWNISFTKDEAKDRYLRRVTVTPDSPTEANQVK